MSVSMTTDDLHLEIARLNRELKSAQMTLLDEFAKAALTGLLAKHGDAGWGPGGEVTSMSGAAETAFEYAQEMLSERGQRV